MTSSPFAGPRVLVAVAAVLLLAAVLAGAPSAGATTCADGSHSNSTGSGTCSHHGGIAGGGSAGAPVDMDCPDFATQQDAQAYFDAHGGSAANNVDDLDADHDGIACEDNASAGGSPVPAPAPTPPVPAGCGPLPVAGLADGATVPYGGRFTLTAPEAGAGDLLWLTVAPASTYAGSGPLVAAGTGFMDTFTGGTAWASDAVSAPAPALTSTPGSYVWQMQDATRTCGTDSAVQRFTVAAPVRCALTARRDGAMVEVRFCPLTAQVTLALDRSRAPGSVIRRKAIAVTPGVPVTVRMHTARAARWVRITYVSPVDDVTRALGVARIG